MPTYVACKLLNNHLLEFRTVKCPTNGAEFLIKIRPKSPINPLVSPGGGLILIGALWVWRRPPFSKGGRRQTSEQQEAHHKYRTWLSAIMPTFEPCGGPELSL